MSRKLKITILIGSLFVICFSLFHIATAHAQTINTGLGQVTVTEIPSSEVPIATAGDAGFLTTHRDITDVYNVGVLIAIELMFWICWNIVRTVYRILTERSKF